MSSPDQLQCDGPVSIFAYGTLKRGGERDHVWPYQPHHWSVAHIRGALYDLGPYPGLLPGDDSIRGELWQFSMDQIPAILAVLDEVEGYCGNTERDCFVRVITEATDDTGHPLPAYVYQLARLIDFPLATRVSPNAAGECEWPAEKRRTRPATLSMSEC